MYFNLSQAIYDGTKQRRCREAISSYNEPRLAWSLLWLILRGKCIVVMLCCDGLGANRSFHTIHRLKRCSGWYFCFRTSWPDLNEYEWQILISCFFLSPTATQQLKAISLILLSIGVKRNFAWFWWSLLLDAWDMWWVDVVVSVLSCFDEVITYSFQSFYLLCSKHPKFWWYTLSISCKVKWWNIIVQYKK